MTTPQPRTSRIVNEGGKWSIELPDDVMLAFLERVFANGGSAIEMPVAAPEPEPEFTGELPLDLPEPKTAPGYDDGALLTPKLRELWEELVKHPHGAHYTALARRLGYKGGAEINKINGRCHSLVYHGYVEQPNKGDGIFRAIPGER